MDKINVLIADNHHLFIRGIESILMEDESLHVIGKACSGKEAFEMAVKLKPDVVLLDINLPIMDGLQSLKLIMKELPEVKVLMLTANEEDDALLDALKSGAKGFLLTNLLPNELLTFIHMAYRGQSIIYGQMASRILETLNQPANSSSLEPYLPEEPIELLTKREKEILAQVIKGLTNREIAEVLFISENTVKNHLRNIMEKLHINNRVQAATYALKEGWLKKI